MIVIRRNHNPATQNYMQNNKVAFKAKMDIFKPSTKKVSHGKTILTVLLNLLKGSKGNPPKGGIPVPHLIGNKINQII